MALDGFFGEIAPARGRLPKNEDVFQGANCYSFRKLAYDHRELA